MKEATTAPVLFGERILAGGCVVRLFVVKRELRMLCECVCGWHEDGRQWRQVFACLDCGVDTSSRTGICEYYTVKCVIWWSYVPEYHGMLCIGCLEDRMGRRLEPSDFTGAPINTYSFIDMMSDRLVDRLGLLDAVH